MLSPYYRDEAVTIYHGDCRDVFPDLNDINLVATDPPYNGVLNDEWDNQWGGRDDEFLSWLADIAGQIATVVTDNATIYLFSSPRLASLVELVISQHFRVLANVVWDKDGNRNGAAGSGIDVKALRTYWTSNSERLIVAENAINFAYQTADDKAKEKSGFWAACQGGKQSVIGDYLQTEFERAGVANRQIAALFPSKTGGLTGCVSNWLLGHNIPTAEQYAKMREFLGTKYLRREYEDLRREYEDLRRPFFLTADDQWGDVWRFPIERNRMHPAQKPPALMSQIIRVSSRPGDQILDPFMGSGTTLRAAKDLGRKAIGIEIEERYCEIAAKRMAQEVLPLEVSKC